ncbi:MAG: PHB depolymerase family esterase [Acidimicrobiales bacterium]
MSTQPTARRTTTTVAVLASLSLLFAACGSGEADEGAVDSIASTTSAPTTTASTEPMVETTTVASTEAPPVTDEVAGVCEGVTPGVNDYTLEAAGVTYPVRLFVPTAIADGAVLPLVLNWHGLGSDGPQQAGFTAYEVLAETEGFLVASPTGPPALGDSRNSWELIQLDSPDRDDVAFASALIDDVVDRFCGDEQRVYSTGMSNGGLFTSRLVCQLADRLAAASSVAGVTHPDECEPSRPMPFIAFHGTADGVVPFDNAPNQPATCSPATRPGNR